jgi:transcriptional regulator with XRE-family HTH domain
MTLLREAIGDSLRRARLAQSRTLREVSTSARVSLGYLSEVERGRKEASSELLAAICAALDVPLSRVLWDVSTIMAGADGGPVREPAHAAATPETEQAAAAESAPEADAEPARSAATATMSVAGAAPRPKIAEDTRIVIPAPSADMLILVKSN